MPFDFQSMAMVTLLALFSGGALLVWVSGVRLSRAADVIANRTGLGHAFTGVLLLGFATSLPEIATTATATLRDYPVLAANNLLGGVAMQMTLLALVDAWFVRGQPLTRAAASSGFLLQGVLLIVLLAIGCCAIVMDEPFSLMGIGFWPMLLGIVYLVALRRVYRQERHPQWQPVEEGPKPAPASQDADQPAPSRNPALQFLAAAVGVLIGGYLVAETAAALAERTGIGETFVGATLVSLTTSLPELTTTLTAARLGALSMAAGNILGTNLLEMALFLPADAMYRGGPIFETLEPSAVLLAALGILVTAIYLWGVLERKHRPVMGLGIDSLLVLLTYLGGMLLYYHVTV